jgi:hypothetical protein
VAVQRLRSPFVIDQIVRGLETGRDDDAVRHLREAMKFFFGDPKLVEDLVEKPPSDLS